MNYYGYCAVLKVQGMFGANKFPFAVIRGNPRYKKAKALEFVSEKDSYLKKVGAGYEVPRHEVAGGTSIGNTFKSKY